MNLLLPLRIPCRVACGGARVGMTAPASLRRTVATTASMALKERLSELIPVKTAEIKDFRARHGSDQVGIITVDMIFGGMRGIKGLIWEGSVLDPEEGIRFRGYSIPECQRKFPKSAGQPQPEAMFHLLLTGEIPTENQVRSLSADWAARAAKIPKHIFQVLDSCPKTLHPMTMLSMGIMAMQSESTFTKAYLDRVPKSTLWSYAFEDAMNLISRLPIIAAYIYHKVYGAGGGAAALNLKPMGPDWASDFAARLGVSKDPHFADLMRLYLTIHADHEGGNVSAHTSHLVGSALADPYLSISAALNGLAGPLHGLANQEVLTWLRGIDKTLGPKCHENKEALRDHLWAWLRAGNVVPGYGHAVLRKTDPRYTCQREFAQAHLADDRLFKLVSALYEVIPAVLTEHGKTKNPWPNVDAHSGVLLQHYNLVQEDFYTVLFGVSRALGCLSGLVWARALGLPIERPKSFSTSSLLREIGNPNKNDPNAD